MGAWLSWLERSLHTSLALSGALDQGFCRSATSAAGKVMRCALRGLGFGAPM
jgi:hypothetical protein